MTMWLAPPEYLVLDIETIAGEPVEAEEWMRRAWSPNPTWKPATIGDRFLQALEKKKEQLALLDTAPVITVALRTPVDCCVLHWLACDLVSIAGVRLERLSDQAAMLRRLAEYLAACGPETVLVGHNLLHFDLPKLRQAMLRHGLRLPAVLVDREQPVYDTMREWSRFSLDDRQYIGLAELLEVLGLEDHKTILSGAMVPELYQQGRYAEILAYAAADVLAQHQVFLRMTGQAEGHPTASGAVSDAPAAVRAATEQVAVGTPEAGLVGTSAPGTSVPGPAHAAADWEQEAEALMKELGIE